ncbi:MAG: insulinase family protein [Lachnospiraceae bacterium]|nr:insulinase family protein [Lachnospiraceae bacterium]
MKIEELKSYEVIERKKLEDLKSEGWLLRHKKTGARVALISNDDENKVFSIGFRTPPKDSTGVAHILEHSVLCGSDNFPVKDPFVELVKGSLNTFLNAMTFADKTLYPVASCNDTDFQNLMHVYLDAVLYPNIYKQDKIFRQEGWHYEMEDEDSELTINGVVYSEMKGAFSSPDDVVGREMMNSLYPDTTYGFESGGDPQNIPDLTYEQFMDFHKRYYHPSNSYIYLYGNMDMAEKLDFIDREYLSAFEERQVDSAVGIQEPFDGLRSVEREYPISDEDDEEKTAYLAYNLSVGDVLDRELYVAFQILDYALCSAPGAPLKQALTDRGIGEEVYSIYDNQVRQPYFSIVSKNTSVSRRQEFMDTIREVLEQIVREGMDQKALLAGINYYEFRYREADYGRYPKGLMYGIQMLDSWLYDDRSPFLHIEANDTFARMRELAENGGFEKLIQTWLLDNPHRSIVTLIPRKGLTAERDRQLREKLAAYKASLSKEEISRIVEDTKALKRWQEIPDAKEDLAKIPMLAREDMKKEAAGFVNEVRGADGTKVLFHNIYTNGIAYVRLVFSADQVPEELFPYLGVLKGVLGLMDTEHYGYRDLFNEVNIETGGISPLVSVYSNIKDRDAYTVTMEMKVKALYPKLARALELMQEIMLTTRYDDPKRLGEILAEGRSRLQGQMISAGHLVAIYRVLAGVSKTAAITEMISGMQFYRLLDGLAEDCCGNGETNAAAARKLAGKLQTLAHILFRPENLMIDFTGDEEGYQLLVPMIGKLKEKLFVGEIPAGCFAPELSVRKEGYRTPGQVQYVCRGGSFGAKGLPYTGALKVLKVMMEYDYLWSNLRVKGGAYGCMCGFGRNGEAYFCSYRDPNLEKTIETYEKAADYVASFAGDERALTQFIIGAIGDLDTPMNPSAKGAFSLSGYMTGLTQEDLQKERDELLTIDQETFRKLAEYIRAFMSDDCLCVVGGSEAIEGSRQLFTEVENLF